MKKTTTKNQKVYTLLVKMLEDGSFMDPRFTFHATDDRDAQSKVWGWLRYQGMTRDDATFREAQGREAEYPEYWMHDEWVA